MYHISTHIIYIFLLPNGFDEYGGPRGLWLSAKGIDMIAKLKKMWLRSSFIMPHQSTIVVQRPDLYKCKGAVFSSGVEPLYRGNHAAVIHLTVE